MCLYPKFWFLHWETAMSQVVWMTLCPNCWPACASIAKTETNHKSLSVGVAPRTESSIFVSLAVVVALFSQQRSLSAPAASFLPATANTGRRRRRCLGCFTPWKMTPVSASDAAATSWMSGAPPVVSLSDIFERFGSLASGRFLIKPIKQMRAGGMTNDIRFIRLGCHTEGNFFCCLLVCLFLNASR